ncbi:GIY-YIG nuclease family protein [Agromyces larvae]|uniref:GIY-YIG nuclease family protein n=1 Tax=Agromyces larvae TaxID=2929802 RepID=A0ABY4C437_9MICO|nr:GIY-YIG nuclease family protein [Agromyces larvae]UOE45984.1 GIY-YIG nuclease family protein [Agromyces larvae]
MINIPEPKTVIYGLYHVDDPERIRYVGQTLNGAASRFKQHLSSATQARRINTPVYRWIRKHGVDAIRCRVLEAVDDASLLDEREVFWVRELGTFRGEYGLNMSAGGGSLGFRHSEDAKRRMSEAAKRRGMTKANAARSLARARGQKVGNSILTREDVIEIKRLLWSGEPRSTLAAKFGVTQPAIIHIDKERTWADAPWPIGPRCTPAARGISPRIQRGQDHHASKLNESAVVDIRARSAEGATRASLAREYGVSSQVIMLIATRRAWKHVA